MGKPGPKPKPACERFEAKTKPSENGCIIWMGAKLPLGYGLFHLDGTMRRAHRVAYELAFGLIPDDAFILHSCDNPPCVNPKHLRAGTQVENMQDQITRKRNTNANKTSCPKGHAYSAENTLIDNGKRRCVICKREQARAYLARKRKAAA